MPLMGDHPEIGRRKKIKGNEETDWKVWENGLERSLSEKGKKDKEDMLYLTECRVHL